MASRNQKRDTRRDLLAAEAAQLRADGYLYSEIAEQLDVDKSTAWRYVNRGLELANQASAEHMTVWRDREAQEMGDVIDAAWNMVEECRKAGEPALYVKAAAALGQIAKASERRAKLFGLDAPQRVELGYDRMTADEAAEFRKQYADGEPEW